jgi:parallel beta-helix repeat protein
MKRGLSIAILAAGTALAGVGIAPPAQAATATCGQVITQSVTLSADVGPCANNGLVVGADGITVDLGGHRVFGTSAAGDGAGVLVAGRTGVTVTNGTVTDFDGGVVLKGGGRNSVNRILAQHNYGQTAGQVAVPGTLYGDGIAVEGSTNNLIQNNEATDNAPFSGIGIYELSDSDHPFPAGPATGNIVEGNSVHDNVGCRAGGTCDNDGIRIEPAVSPGNIIMGNTVARNGLDGISLFSLVHGQTVMGNVVTDNGFHGAVKGDGIRVFGYSNLVRGNTVRGNAQDGISVGRRSTGAPNNPLPGTVNGRTNQILGNTTGTSGHFDLYDSNPACDNNAWHANSSTTAFPACTTAP